MIVVSFCFLSFLPFFLSLFLPLFFLSFFLSFLPSFLPFFLSFFLSVFFVLSYVLFFASLSFVGLSFSFSSLSHFLSFTLFLCLPFFFLSVFLCLFFLFLFVSLSLLFSLSVSGSHLFSLPLCFFLFPSPSLALSLSQRLRGFNPIYLESYFTQARQQLHRPRTKLGLPHRVSSYALNKPVSKGEQKTVTVNISARGRRVSKARVRFARNVGYVQFGRMPRKRRYSKNTKTQNHRTCKRITTLQTHRNISLKKTMQIT